MRFRSTSARSNQPTWDLPEGERSVILPAKNGGKGRIHDTQPDSGQECDDGYPLPAGRTPTAGTVAGGKLQIGSSIAPTLLIAIRLEGGIRVAGCRRNRVRPRRSSQAVRQ